MQKDDVNVPAYQNKNWCRPKSDQSFFLTFTVRGPFHRKDFEWKNMGLNYTGVKNMGLISEKTETFYAEFNKKLEAATSSYSITGD